MNESLKASFNGRNLYVIVNLIFVYAFNTAITGLIVQHSFKSSITVIRTILNVWLK